MATCISAQELWSEIESDRPVLIMGNSESVNMFDHSVYDRFYTIGCNSRLHIAHTPDITLMVDNQLPKPSSGCDILSHLPKWQKEHDGTCYAYELGNKLQFHPDISTNVIDFAETSAYMAIVTAYMMGYRTITFVGLDLTEVAGKDRIDSPNPGVEKRREVFFNKSVNHLLFLIKKMTRYNRCRFYSLSPHSRLLMGGNVRLAHL